MSRMKKPDILTRFTSKISALLGRSYIFIIAFALLIVWAASGPFLGFSDTWQLIVNTATTTITFLMVFIIQNTQNRDNLALNIKIDALMEKLSITEKELLQAEDESDKRLEKVKERMES